MVGKIENEGSRLLCDILEDILKIWGQITVKGVGEISLKNLHGKENNMLRLSRRINEKWVIPSAYF